MQFDDAVSIHFRVRNFKAAGIPWHSESTEALEALARAGGRVCVECPSLGCVNATSRQPDRGIEASPYFK